MVQYSLANYDDAAAQFEKLIALQPSDDNAYYWLGRSAFMDKNYRKAKSALEHAASIAPRDAGTHYWLGNTLIKLDDPEGANKALRKAVDLDPADADAQLQLLTGMFLSLVEQDAIEEAEMTRLMEQALDQANTTIAVAQAVGEEAAAEAAQYMRADLWNNLASAYALRDETLALAEEYIAKALQANGGNPLYLNTKALILIRLTGRAPGSAEAESTLQHAEALLKSALERFTVEDQKSAAESWVRLGQIEMLRGRKDAADRHFVKAIELDPLNAEAKRLPH